MIRDIALDESEVAVLCEAARVRLRSTRPLLPAPLRAVDAIEAAAKPFDEGLAIERRAFLELMESPESKGLRHAFFAERAAGKVDGITPATPIRPLDQAAVIGAGTMGAGIAVALLDAGIPLWLVEADQAGWTAASIAARSSDIDVVYLIGYGFPRWRGGPMFHADQVGLDQVLRQVREFAHDPHGDPAFWTPAPLLERLAESGSGFTRAEKR